MKYDNILTIFCIVCIIVEAICMFLRLPNIIIYFIPCLLLLGGFILTLLMIIKIIKQKKQVIDKK